MGSSTSTSFGKKTTSKQIMDHYANISGNPKFLQGKVAVVTGGSSGIGIETCKALAYAGCRVILSARNVEAGQKCIETEIMPAGLGNYAVPEATDLIAVAQLDLEDLASIKAFAAVVSKEERIDFLILNAGVMMIQELEYTKHGFEKQIGHHYHLY
jgi:NAD(P)-dependent dehydrogenase (short-subunit alcohol dehydrogenase family)